jgi:hypothetical protein
MPTVIMSDALAREHASYWHDGQFSALYALSSTGTISNETVDEINENIKVQTGPDGLAELYSLRDYCQYHGIRGPQKGWSDLRW